MNPPIPPVETASTPKDSQVLRIAGRVVQSGGAHLVVANTAHAIEVHLDPSVVAQRIPPIGSLVEVDGCLMAPNVIAHAVVRSCQRPVQPEKASGDVQRFLYRGVGRTLALRSQITHGLRNTFHAMGFLEIETPLLVPSPGLDIHLTALDATDGYLITSPEYQMKRLLVGGIPQCFQFAKCFRAEEYGALHNREFTMLEWYRTFASMTTVMDDTEQVLEQAHVIAVAAGFSPPPCPPRPFPRLTVQEAFLRYAHLPEKDMLCWAKHEPVRFFQTLSECIEPALARDFSAVFLTDYPITQASLARQNPENPQYAERFELYVGKTKLAQSHGAIELCNGFGELTDPIEQRARFARDQADRASLGLVVYPTDERFLRALEEGLPPCAGNALGLDRLVCWAADLTSIHDAMAFPSEFLLNFSDNHVSVSTPYFAESKQTCIKSSCV